MSPHIRISRDGLTPDWIEWNGGECPVEPNARVDVRFRGSKRIGQPEALAREAGAFQWSHYGDGGDIIAYRVVQP